MNFDEEMMSRALELAMNGWGKTSPNPLVGAVIVKDGKIVAEGWHDRLGGPHAEVQALDDAKSKGIDVSGATMYINLEPCSHFGRTPPCSLAIIRSGIRRVVTAMVDPNPLVAGRGHTQIHQAGIEVVTGVLEEEAKKLNEIFIHYMTKLRPFVCLKMAASLDGKTVTSGGESQWISGSESQTWVHRQRSRYSSVGVGINTVLSDDPSLTARDQNNQERERQPLRIVIDPHLRLPLDSKLVKTAQHWPVLVVCREDAQEEKQKLLESHQVKLFPCPTNREELNLSVFLDYLHSLEIDSLFLEGGSNTAWHFLNQGLIDKFCLILAPLIIAGETAKGVIGGRGFEKLSEALRIQRRSILTLGQDFLIEAYP